MGIFTKRAGGGPRQAARRASRLWKQRFKKFGIAAAAMTMVCAAVAALWTSGSFSRMKEAAASRTLALTAAAGFRVADITVTGRNHVTQEDIVSKLDMTQGAPLFSVNPAELQKKIATLSWVKSASVSRRLPGTVAIHIVERTPAALWQYQKKITVIDADGAALDTGLDGYGRLPLVVGADAGKNASALAGLLKAEPAIAEMVQASTRVGNRRWDLHLKNGMVVMLPEKDAELALARLAKAEDKDHLLSKNIVTIDLRLPDRMVVEAGTKAQDDAGKS